MIRILLADDHTMVRDGLERILEENPDLDVVATAASGDDVLRTLAAVPVDVLVLDVSMPGPGVFAILGALKAAHPKVRCVVLSMHPESQYAVRVLQAGASGFVSKDRSPELLVEAIRKAHSGGLFVSPTLAESLAAQVVRPSEHLPHDALSDRELEVLVRLGRGQSVKAIAADLSLSRKTVSTYHSRIRHKLRLQSDADLVRYVLEHRLTG